MASPMNRSKPRVWGSSSVAAPTATARRAVARTVMASQARTGVMGANLTAPLGPAKQPEEEGTAEEGGEGAHRRLGAERQEGQARGGVGQHQEGGAEEDRGRQQDAVVRAEDAPEQVGHDE